MKLNYSSVLCLPPFSISIILKKYTMKGAYIYIPLNIKVSSPISS